MESIKGLMTGKGPIISDPVHRLVTHKMVNSIIKETNLDPCSELSSEDLAVSGLFDWFKVHFCHLWYFV